jgi:hypothetical protein
LGVGTEPHTKYASKPRAERFTGRNPESAASQRVPANPVGRTEAALFIAMLIVVLIVALFAAAQRWWLRRRLQLQLLLAVEAALETPRTLLSPR